MAIDEGWYIRGQNQQRKYNLIIALGTVVTALVGVLQVIKLYDYAPEAWMVPTIAVVIGVCVIAILYTLIKRD